MSHFNCLSEIFYKLDIGKNVSDKSCMVSMGKKDNDIHLTLGRPVNFNFFSGIFLIQISQSLRFCV